MDERRSRRQGAVPRNVNRVHADTPARKTCGNTASLKISKRSQVSVDVQRRKLNIETEKARQKLEQHQRELDNKIRLLNMEHELKEALIIDCSSSQNTNGDIRSQLPVTENNDIGNYDRIQSWVENAQEVSRHTRIVSVFDENRNFIKGVRQNEQQNGCERNDNHLNIQKCAS
ncbi:hypothetical protein JTB14_007786 [Gonioctena quinquepunctata]|nr:hypothetical protein JTB14_007786 [Gonioctena quinquepunctata]